MESHCSLIICHGSCGSGIWERQGTLARVGSLWSNSKWVLICLGTISKAASLSYLAQSGAGAAGAPGHLGAVCRFCSTVRSGVLVFLSQPGAPKVCVLSWAEASHIVLSAPFYWGAVTKTGQVPGKGSWTPPLIGEKSVSPCGRAGGMENTVAPRWLLGNLHLPGRRCSCQGSP